MSMDLLKEDYSFNPEYHDVIEQMTSQFTSKEVIEAMAIEEIHQFYTFHGGLYKLGKDYNAAQSIVSPLTGKPFPVDTVVWLDEIYSEEENFLLMMVKTVDSAQLKRAAADYITQMLGAEEFDGSDLDGLAIIENETWTASLIHNWGWVLYSIQTKTVAADNFIQIEKRIIEIQ